ncbi:MAG: flagellar protein FlaI, partial [Candidatus Korarchaeota archaeon]|nr:flagellar protein FlaI [Candidatus Korarchaeota archaeon]
MALKLRIRPPRRRRRERVEEGAREPEFGEKPSYLLEYIEKAREELGEEPVFVERLTGEMKKWRRFNLIYPVGGGIFIHVYSPRETETGYNRYVVVEPPKPHPRLFSVIEEALAMVISPEHVPRSSEEKKAILLGLMERIIEPVEEPVSYEEIRARNHRIPVYRSDIDYLKYHLIREKVGVGLLEPFLRA